MKTIKLPCYGIVLNFENNSGTIESDLCHEESDFDYLANIDVLESLILAHAVAGVDIESPAYIEGIETTVDAILNNC